LSWDTIPTYSAYSNTGRAAGLVPAGSGTTTTKYLCENGSWVAPPDSNTITTISTSSTAKGTNLGASSGAVELHNIARTGSWSDLLNKPAAFEVVASASSATDNTKIYFITG
jgi:hypothetical protein